MCPPQGSIDATTNTLEFALRENNTGSFPRGLSLMLKSVAAWIYDRDPLEPLRFDAPLQKLKQRLADGEDVFRPLIKTLLLDNPAPRIHRTQTRRKTRCDS